MTIQITGFTTSNKVPGFYAETVYGAGPISAGSIPLVCLLVGNKTSGGSAVVDVDINDIGSEDDATTYYGTGSELARMAYQALKEPGVKLKGIAPAEGGGAVGATMTITVTGPATTTGTWTYYIDGTDTVTGGIASGDTATQIAAAISAAINAKAKLSVTSSPAVGVVTLTKKSKGPRGNDGIVFQDITKLATGVTSTLGGGGASVTGGGIHFTAGATADNVTNVLAVILPDTYDRIAFAEYDATNAALIKTHMDAKAGVLEGRLQHGVVAQTGSLATAITLAQTTLNAYRLQVLWMLNGEVVPSEMAARFAAKRTVAEQTDPAGCYDGKVITGMAPQRARADWSSTSTLVSALDNGVTPFATNPDGTVYCVRSIVSHSLLGATADYRTLDTADAVVPDYVRTSAKLVWLTDFLPSNPRIADDPPSGAKERPAGVATPKRWTQRMVKMLQDLNDQLIVLYDVTDATQPVSEYNSAAKRIMGILPATPCPNQHQIGVSVRQLSA
jgi:phage tail sheath gpL-like